MGGATVPNPGGPGSSASDPQPVISALAFTGRSPLAAFSEQTIAGFYKDAGWTNTLGTPIWDFGAADSQFTATPGALVAPVTVFDPTASPLNGGSLTAVLASLGRADHLYSSDEVAGILANARAADGADASAALATTTAALDFDLSSSPSLPLSEQLNVPVALDVTITPATGLPTNLPTVAHPALAATVREVPIGIDASALLVLPE